MQIIIWDSLGLSKGNQRSYITEQTCKQCKKNSLFLVTSQKSTTGILSTKYSRVIAKAIPPHSYKTQWCYFVIFHLVDSLNNYGEFIGQKSFQSHHCVTKWLKSHEKLPLRVEKLSILGSAMFHQKTPDVTDGFDFNLTFNRIFCLGHTFWGRGWHYTSV